MKNLMFLIAFTAIAFSFAACKKNSDCKENEDSLIFCTQQYDPVCGCNNKTYGNACEAQARGITDFTKAECK